jgi:hypothetical protein
MIAEKWNWFAAADVFLACRCATKEMTWKVLESSFLEAALGRSSIGRRERAEGAKEAVVHDRTGLMVNPMDVGEVTDAVARLLKEGEAENAAGRAGKSASGERISMGGSMEDVSENRKIMRSC